VSDKQRDVKYDGLNNIIILKGKEEPSNTNILQAFTQVVELSKETGCKNVLVDGMATKKLPDAFDIWKISTSMLVHIKTLLKLRIAYANSNAISSSFEFFDNYLTNRGVPIQKFDNLDEAKNWLLKDKLT